MPDLTLPTRHCLRCGHTWIPRKVQPPRTCPKCNNAYYDRPRQEKNTTRPKRKPPPLTSAEAILAFRRSPEYWEQIDKHLAMWHQHRDPSNTLGEKHPS